MNITRSRIASLTLLAALASASASAADVSMKAVEAVKPALVRIVVSEASYDGGREQKSQISGSGVIIRPDGYAVTNHHVAGHALRLVCTLSNREIVEANLVGTDALTDISVIKLRPSSKPYPFARWGDSSKLKVGDAVLAMGSPRSLSASVTLGIVSNTEMMMPSFLAGALTLDGEDVGSIVRWIGHDASISPGNSGGPLVNAAGEVVGINEISVGLAGAIPGNLARAVADEIIATGHVRRSWLGVSAQPLLRGSDEKNGVLIGGVLPDSPAAAAGWRAGDILLRLGGQEYSARFDEDMPEISRRLAALEIDRPLAATLKRGGAEVNTTITPVLRHEIQPTPREVRALGLTVSDISPVRRLELKRANTDGAFVVGVRSGGPAGIARPAVESGDVLVEIAGQPVRSAADVSRLLDGLHREGAEENPVLIALERKSERILTVANIAEPDESQRLLDIRRARLPISGQVLTDPLRRAMNLEGRRGLRVTRVNAGSTAETAGLLVGDIIMAVDGDPLDMAQPEDREELENLIRQYPVGEEVALTVLRGGEERDVSVILEAAPPSSREMARYRDTNFEFSARDLSWDDRENARLDKDAEGVYIEEVTDGGWAALGELRTGDILLAVDGKTIADVHDLKAAMKAAGDARAPRVALHVRRGIQERFLDIESAWAAGKTSGAPTP